MLIMIASYYVYKWLQQFLTHLTGLRKGLVTVNVHFMYCSLFSCVIFVCVCVCVHAHACVCACVHACVHVHCVVCFVSVCPTSCLAYCFGTCSMVSSVLWCPVFYGVQCSMVSSVFTYFHIYIFIFIFNVMNYVRLLELLGLSTVLDAHYYCCCCCYYY